MNMHLMTTIFAIAAVAATFATQAVAAATAEDRAVCGNSKATPDRQIAACSALLEDPGSKSPVTPRRSTSAPMPITRNPISSGPSPTTTKP